MVVPSVNLAFPSFSFGIARYTIWHKLGSKTLFSGDKVSTLMEKATEKYSLPIDGKVDT